MMSASTITQKRYNPLSKLIHKVKSLPKPSFVKRQFNKLVWPTTEYISKTSVIVVIITLLAMALLHLVFDPLAIKLVLTVKQ